MDTTIRQNFEQETEIKKSRFICHLQRISSEAEARDFIAAVKKQHYKANHNCFAYTLGEHQEIQRSSDDGEPTGTAGVPMLEILKKRELIDVAAVVTRYFGGIKLGAGGLIRAYAGAVNQAVDAVGLDRFVMQQELILSLDYAAFDNLQRWLSEQNLAVASSEFLSNITVHLYVNLTEVEEFLSNLTEKFKGKIACQTGQKQLIEVEI